MSSTTIGVAMSIIGGGNHSTMRTNDGSRRHSKPSKIFQTVHFYFYYLLELHGPSRALAILAAPQGFASLRYATLRFAPRSLFK